MITNYRVSGFGCQVSGRGRLKPELRGFAPIGVLEQWGTGVMGSKGRNMIALLSSTTPVLPGPELERRD